MTIKNLIGQRIAPLRASFSPSFPAFYQGLVAQMRTLPLPRVLQSQLHRIGGHLFPGDSEYVSAIADALGFFPQLYPDLAGQGQALREQQHEADGYLWLHKVLQAWADACYHSYVVCQSTAVQHGKQIEEGVRLGAQRPDLFPGLNHPERLMQMWPGLRMLSDYRDAQAKRRLDTIARKRTDPTYPQRLAEAKRQQRERRAAKQRREERRSEISDLMRGLRGAKGSTPADR